MPRRSHSRSVRDDLPIQAEINVTSLVDVAFTLLVIFIITAPALQGGIEVDVPEADVQPLTAEDDPFFVSITSDGRIFVGRSEREMTLQEFREGFPQLIEAAGAERVYVRSDSVATVGLLTAVMGTAQAAGIDIALVAVPWTQYD